MRAEYKCDTQVSEESLKPKNNGLEMLKNRDGDLKAVAFPAGMSGSGYHPPILFWKIHPKVWTAGRPTIEIVYASDNDEIKIDECFELPAREGSLVMERDISFHRIKYSAEARKIMRKITEQTPAIEMPAVPRLIECRDENGCLISCAYADEDTYGYGWQENVLYWRLTEAAWEMETNHVAKVMYVPLDGMPVSKIVYDKIFDIQNREGSVMLDREIAYALVCNESFSKFLEL